MSGKLLTAPKTCPTKRSDLQIVGSILVPTTILAFQHYKTFKERLKDLPCNIIHLLKLHIYYIKKIFKSK